jgi:hypothetical protein
MYEKHTAATHQYKSRHMRVQIYTVPTRARLRPYYKGAKDSVIRCWTLHHGQLEVGPLTVNVSEIPS